MSALAPRPFGGTGLNLPGLGMGCGFPGFAGFDRSIETIRRALELGIQYFDTSVLYRNGATQPIVGFALEGAKQPTFVATKIGYFREARHFRSPEAMLVQLGESLRLLRRDAVDLLQIHEADWDVWWRDRSDIGPCQLFDLQGDFDFQRAPVMQFLREAKARRLCRHIGITGNNARHLGHLIREIDGLDSVLVAYNYAPLNVSAREHILPAVAAKKMAVVVAGLFTFIFRIPEGWRREGTYFGPRADEQLAALQRLQRECGIPMVELSMRFVAADPRISIVLAGSCHPQEIEQNAATFQMPPLPGDIHSALEKIAADFDGPE